MKVVERFGFSVLKACKHFQSCLHFKAPIVLNKYFLHSTSTSSFSPLPTPNSWGLGAWEMVRNVHFAPLMNERLKNQLCCF